jgi:hypothetical protein
MCNCTLVSKRITVETLKSYITNWKNGGPSSYQIIGDNVDMMIKIKHQASTKPNKKAFIGFICLVSKIEPMTSLMTNQLVLLVICNLVTSCHQQRITKNFCMISYSCLLVLLWINVDVVVRHIPHRYSDAMKLQSEQASTVY